MATVFWRELCGVAHKKQRLLVWGAGDTQGRKFDSVLRVFEGRWLRKHLAQSSSCKIHGNRNVPNLWRDDSKRNLNLNWWDGDWNDNYRFLAVRYIYCFSRDVFSGVLFASWRFQPPSILPTSARCSDKWIYFLLSSARVSHASCKSSFMRSTREMARSSRICFSGICE